MSKEVQRKNQAEKNLWATIDRINLTKKEQAIIWNLKELQIFSKMANQKNQ